MRSFFFYLGCILVGAAVLRLRALARQRLSVLCRLHRAAIHRAGDRLEHPRRLLRLCEFRHRGVLCRRRLFVGGAAQARHERRPLFSGIARRHRQARSAAEHPDADHHRRHRVRPDRARHRLSDAAAARRVLRHRHACARGRAANADRQLGLRRRLARRLYHPAGRSADHRQLHPVSVPGHAGAFGGRASRSRASSSSRGSAMASPPSATTSSRPRPAACRRCGSS